MLPKYKIGSDPEFSVLQEGARVSANTIIRTLFENDSRLDNNSLVCDSGEFGCDGCAATGELRPKPELDPRAATQNIKNLLQEFSNKKSGLDLSTLSLWAPIGGHIHLELPEAHRNGNSERLISSKVKQIMSFYWPIILGEHRTNLNLRLKSYGKVTDWRTDFDNKPTVELRAPTAEWLTTEEITRATLSYFSVIWHEIWEHPRNINKDIVFTNEKQLRAMQELALADFKMLTKSCIQAIKRNIRTFELYPEYKKEINLILDYEKVLSKKKDVNFSILSGWGLKEKKQTNLTKRALLAKKTSKKDYNFGTNRVWSNSDKNCSFIAELLGSKISDGLAIKKNYFFYGLREGADQHIVSCDGKLLTPFEARSDEELSSILNIINKMDNRAKSYSKAANRDSNAHRTLDFKTGKIITETPVVYSIGIPLAVRESKNWKPTLELVYAVESGQLKPEAITLKKDPSYPKGQPPLIAQSFEIDQSSQGARIADETIYTVIQEQEHEARESLMETLDETNAQREALTKALIQNGIGFVSERNMGVALGIDAENSELIIAFGCYRDSYGDCCAIDNYVGTDRCHLFSKRIDGINIGLTSQPITSTLEYFDLANNNHPNTREFFNTLSRVIPDDDVRALSEMLNQRRGPMPENIPTFPGINTAEELISTLNSLTQQYQLCAE